MATEGRRLLESWKEIAAYLKRSEKTCRRFEETFGLPVHRLDGTPKARVFAYTDELDQWLLAKLNHAQEEAQEAAEEEAAKRARAEALVRKRKRLTLLIGVGGVAVLAGAAGLLWPRFSPAPGPILPHNPSLAVLPFDNPAKDPGLEPWRTGLADLVITDLRQSRYVSVVGVTDLVRKLVELKLGEVAGFSDGDVKTVAEKAGVDYVATGSIAREKDGIVVSVRVHGARTGDNTDAIETGCSEERGVFSAADRVSKGIKLAMGLSRRHVSKDIDRGAAEISTASPQAFKLYSQGYRLAGLAKYVESASSLQRAVEVDPGFALAYRYLYRAYQNLGRGEEAQKYAQKAIDLSGRLSERERGELEFAFYRDFAKDPAAQRDAAERIYKSYPQDRTASRFVLDNYIGLEEWDKALAVAEGAWSANKTDPNICQQLTICYLNAGWAEKAVALLSGFIEANPGAPMAAIFKRNRAYCYLQMNKLDDALAEAERGLAQDPEDPGGLMLSGHIHLYRKDLTAARREFQKVLGQDDPWNQLDALAYMRDMLLMQGKVEEAKAALRKGLEIGAGVSGEKARGIRPRTASLHREFSYLHMLTGDLEDALKEIEETLVEIGPSDGLPPVNLLGEKAIILLEMGRMEDFTKLAEEIKGHVERGRKPRLMRIYHYLLGRRELETGDPRKAIDHFWRAMDLLSVPGRSLAGADPEYFYYLAEAMRLSRYGPSFSMYEKVTLPAVNRLHAGDLYAMSLYRLAQSYDGGAQSARTVQVAGAGMAKAAEYYRQFLALWDGADPLFGPIVEDARKRLAAVKGR